ncbi:Crp/Fnr family transcriptional regulator [Pedobacter duraquae]|uniref:CRP-like cAMP-binding protein n=1 Tax=Pedobacter duraquae TaxID=425511 RepID=A0A4R6IFP7_9SPHI|nr:cyclic nucleotide-binding domain-containing protein [Pedobacter duraquae]TDO20864.1 CRP-like cAMP-binding protein [Pedobacter duraquae]
MNLDDIISAIYDLPEESRILLQACIVEVNFPKGHVLIEAGKIESSVFFIKKGIVRAFSEVESNSVTFWFGTEGDTILSIENYVANRRSYESIELLDDSQLYQIRTDKLQELYHVDIHLANWGRKLVEYELIKTEKRLITMQVKSAADRYTELMEKSPDLLRRAKLIHLASYLGITQVSLSRIRANIGK